MAVETKDVKDFEDKVKQMLFGKVGEISSQQHKLISGIEESGKFVDLESNLPNLGITLNNKLVELQHKFQNAGISMYSQKVEDYGPLKLNFVGSSFVGAAVIFDLINYASRGTQNLADYSKKMNEVTDEKVKKVQALEKAGPIRRFFAKIRSFFVPVKQEDMTYTPEETESINSHLRDYRETDNQLLQYNLEDNIVQALVNEIAGPQKFGDLDIKHKYSASNVPGLLEECVIPDLKKLGLEHLIPQLQEALIEEYKKDLPDPEIYKVNDKNLHLYVPDFTRESGTREDVDLEELSRQVKSVIAYGQDVGEGTSKSLEQKGISLRDVYLVDITSNTSDRQAAAIAIGEELQPVQEVMKNKEQEVSGKSLDD